MLETMFHVAATGLLGVSALFWHNRGALNLVIRLMMLFGALTGCVVVAGDFA